jgi:outer membrane protein OmpA-like peptidoglycan-associated protein/opacity protein-like surface antigen
MTTFATGLKPKFTNTQNTTTSMASKKYTLILGILSLFMSAAYSQQNDATYDWRDSSKIAAKNLPQHSEFLNNQYPYPAKPRNMWELGLHGGFSMIRGDVSPNVGGGGGFSLRKALGHTFSLRGDYTGSINRGTDYRLRSVDQLPLNNVDDPWQFLYRNFPATGPGRRQFLANYQNRMHQLSLDVIATLNNKSYYRGNPRMLVNVFTGPSLLFMDVDVNALNAQGQPYNWSTSGVNFLAKRKEIKDAVERILEAGQGNNDGVNQEYENNGGVLNGSRDPLGRYRTGDSEDATGQNRFNHFARLGFSLGGGLQFKISDKFNIGLEQRFTVPFDDNLDALPVGRSSQDIVSYTNARFNINLGNRARKVQPLFWLNPNNYVYSELNNPQHMKLPKPILPDADGDGVTDQFDMEPNTPAGCPVDVRGVSRDTDGDGVPDCRDKELLTPQNCFPVNADGVGNCPEPACCTELRNRAPVATTTDCAIGNLPSVQFRSGTTLSRDAQAVLASAAAQIKANPTCRIRVTGHGASDKRAQQLSWDRVNAVITYLVERQGISQDRFIFTYGEEGDPSTVDLSGTTEEGPNTVPAPHPNLKRG